MNIKWLEDFAALVDSGSFTRAAQIRHVTQPAFSRRIRALENALGVELVDRNSYPLQLTAAGTEYVGRIQSLLADVQRLRADIRNSTRDNRRVVVATQHSLSVSFCPAWYRSLRKLVQGNSFCINAMNLYECIDVFLAGQCDLLLCYVTRRGSERLEGQGIDRIDLGSEALVPVCMADRSGDPVIDIERKAPVPLIAYPDESFLGDLVRTECIPAAPSGVTFDVIYETALCEGVRSMVLDGMGMAWLPARLVQAQIRDGTVRKVRGLAELQLQISLFRRQSGLEGTASAIWEHLARRRKTSVGAGYAPAPASASLENASR
jgi:DNA-binding transcriptional LysR family regulator